MITTTKYGLKKPQDDDSADLRVFVGDNMDILDGHTHSYADITGKPTAFTPTLMSGTAVGGGMVGNGLGMSGNYLYVKTLTADGTKINTTNNSIAIDRTTTDTWYALATHTHDWTVITGKPTAFVPVPMTNTTIGGAIVGNGLAMSVDNYLYIRTGTGLFIDTSNYSVAINRTTVDTWYSLAGHTHAYNTLTGIPTTFTPPIATATVLGGIKVGTGLTVDGTGLLSATGYTLPIASSTILGGIKVGTGLTIDGTGVLSATPYSLPLMSGTAVGGAMVGNGLAMSGNYLFVKTISADGTRINATNNNIAIDRTVVDTWYALAGHTHAYSSLTGIPSTFTPPIATTSVLGGIIVGTGLTIDASGVLSTTGGATVTWDTLTGKPATFTPPIASATVLGGIKVGTGLAIDGTGILSTTSVDWATITGKPATFTPTLASATTIGGSQVGNGLGMSGNYLYVKTSSAGGTKLNTTTTYAVEIDRTTVDTWYAPYTHSHAYSSLTGIPSTFNPPIASPTVLGGIMIGSGLTIDANGVVSASATTYTLPIASPTVLGGIMVGSGLAIDVNGVLSATGTAYTLPIASAGTLGGIKVGTGLTIDGTGILAVGSLSYLPLAGGTITGAVQINNQLNINAVNNSLIQTQPLANTIWYGIMKDATTYSYAMGRFTANSDNIDLRAYFGNLTIMTGRSTLATTADITIQTNQSNATGVTSQNIHLMPNTSVGTAGYTKVWSALNVTGQITQNGGLNVIQQSPVAGTGTILNIWTGTQAQYDVLSKDPSTVYYIVG